MPKGSRFEREICRRLSEWIDPTADDVLFWRTAGSGGRATNRKRRGQATNRAHCGDLAAVDERGRLLTDLITFELKNGYSRHTLHHLLDQPKRGTPKYAEWIVQAKASAEAAGTPFWALLHHRNGRETLMVVPESLGQYFSIQTRCARVWTPDLGALNALEFNAWLMGCCPDDLLAIARVERVKAKTTL